MRNDHFTKIELDTKVEPFKETNPIASDMEEWESKLQTVEETIQCLRQGLRSLDRATVLASLASIEQTIQGEWYRVGAPKPTNERRWIHKVDRNWCERGASVVISQDLIGSSLNTFITHTGKMQRGVSRARRWLRVCATYKILCLH